MCRGHVLRTFESDILLHQSVDIQHHLLDASFYLRGLLTRKLLLLQLHFLFDISHLISKVLVALLLLFELEDKLLEPRFRTAKSSEFFTLIHLLYHVVCLGSDSIAVLLRFELIQWLEHRVSIHRGHQVLFFRSFILGLLGTAKPCILSRICFIC